MDHVRLKMAFITSLTSMTPPRNDDVLSKTWCICATARLTNSSTMRGKELWIDELVPIGRCVCRSLSMLSLVHCIGRGSCQVRWMQQKVSPDMLANCFSVLFSLACEDISSNAIDAPTTSELPLVVERHHLWSSILSLSLQSSSWTCVSSSARA